MPESRFLKIIIVALLLLNAGTLGYLWLHNNPQHPPPGGRGGGHGENTGEYLRRALQLTDSQEHVYHSMREQHHASVAAIRDRMREQKRSLYALMRDADTLASKPAAAALMDSLAAGQHEIERITYVHFRELRMLCTPSQQGDFDEVIGEALERMR